MPKALKCEKWTFNNLVKILDEEKPCGKQVNCHNTSFHVNFNHE